MAQVHQVTAGELQQRLEVQQPGLRPCEVAGFLLLPEEALLRQQEAQQAQRTRG